MMTELETLQRAKMYIDKLAPITYDLVHHTYRKIGEIVGHAFSDGKALK